MVLCGPGDDGVSLSVRVRAGATADAGRSRAAARAPPSLQVAIEVTPLEVWLSPGQVPTVAAIISHLSEAAKQPSAAAPAEQGLSASVASLRSSQALDTLIAPGYKSLVADAILWGWGGSAAKEEEEEDIPEAEARKALGDSLHAAFPGAAPGPAGASMLARSMLAEDQLKASAEPSFLLDFRLAGVALVVALSDEPPTVEGGCPPAGQLVAEASRLDLSLQSASGGTEIELSIWSLEAREQLPLEHPDAAGPDGGLEAFGRLTSFLPNGQAQVPSPTFSGLYTPGGAWPGSGAGGPHNPTSTVYASCLAASNMTLALGGGLAASMASSFMGAGVQARGDAHSPAMLQDRSMEVWPVFVAADSDGTSEGKLPSLRAVLRQPRDRDDEAPTLDLRTGPSAVWLRMPLLRQIASLAARVSAGCAVALEPQGLGTQPEHRASRDWQRCGMHVPLPAVSAIQRCPARASMLGLLSCLISTCFECLGLSVASVPGLWPWSPFWTTSIRQLLLNLEWMKSLDSSCPSAAPISMP